MDLAGQLRWVSRLALAAVFLGNRGNAKVANTFVNAATYGNSIQHAAVQLEL